MQKNNNRKCEIWAVGGGKGGVGKSFVISSVATSLANMGKKVILVDADLGGANLHTFLGVSRPKCSLTDFFDRKVPLADLIVETGTENMGLLSGAIGSLAPENIKFTQKVKFLNHIKNLDADHVVIDLGAGTHFNTIDTFLLADKMVIVIVPELVSIENMYYFLKNVFFRRLVAVLGVNGYRTVVLDTWKNRIDLQINNFKQLISHLKKISTEVNNIISAEMDTFSVNLILNQARNNQDILLGNSVKSICLKYFGIKSNYTGYIEYDDLVSRSVNRRQSYMLTYPTSRCAREIDRLTHNLLENKQISILK